MKNFESPVLTSLDTAGTFGQSYTCKECKQTYHSVGNFKNHLADSEGHNLDRNLVNRIWQSYVLEGGSQS